MSSLFFRLPLTVRLPLVVAGMIFLGTLLTTQTVIYSLSVRFESQMRQVAQVYLDGLSAALLPHAATKDQTGLRLALERALTVHDGIIDRRLLFLDSGGAAVAKADRPGLPPLADLPEGVGKGPQGAYFDRADSSMWSWRKVTVFMNEEGSESKSGVVVANLDLSQFAQERQHLQRTLTGIGILLSTLCALAGFALVRQVQRSVILLAEHLEHVTDHGPEPIPAEKISAYDHETAKLVQAFNRMVHGVKEREAMLSRMAEQEREAVLGRMAASLAHEVRNPLGGVLTALNTLRKFGDNPSVQKESIDFMERGLLAIQHVADATLSTHRASRWTQNLSPQDILDVQRLTAGEARQRSVRVESDVQIPDTLPVSAAEVRQVLLNLLLNAIQATRPGGTVTVRGRVIAEELKLEVSDEGPGLDPELADHLEQGVPSTGRAGLGVDVVVRLMEQLKGRVSVEAHSNRGTHIVLFMPLKDEAES